MAGWSIFENGSEVNCTENRDSNELIDRCLSDSTSDDDVKWGDCDDKLRCLFDQVLMVLLRGVYAKNGIRPIPALLGDGRAVDLFKLFCLVRDRGGYRSVSEDNLWGLVAEKFGFDYKLCASLKLIYFKYLDELDQWLNRITRDRVSANGSYECGGNLGLLSLELEKRFRDFSTDVQDLINKDDEIGHNKICKHINVAFKESLYLPDAEKGSEVHSVVRTDVDGDILCDNKEFVGEVKQCAVRNDSASRKRKRDIFAGMLSWLIKVAKNPCHPSIGRMPECSTWKESGGKDFWSAALSVREARLQKRCTDSNEEQSPLHQKKQKMHPSMYEDDILPNHSSAEGPRCSKRLLSLAKISPYCCNSSSVDECKFSSPPMSPSKDGCHKLEHLNVESPATRVVDPTVKEAPVEKHVLVGPRFQAEVPIWIGVVSESDSKWLGTQIWIPDPQEGDSCSEIELPGKGRPDFCNCPFPGSVECYRFHIAENRMKLRRELGLAFYHWKFDRMGEEVSLSWSVEEEKIFKQTIRLHKPSLGKSYFPRKTRTDLVSYYYNVFLINRRSYQNRVTPKDIDSDDDEAEFGSVSEAFGLNAVKVRVSEPLKCYQNEQVTEFD